MSEESVATFVSGALAELANPEDAGAMAAYMKTDQPFYGVRRSGVAPIVREVVRRFPARDRSEYRSTVRAMWQLPHREEQYVALGYARAFPDYIDADSIGMYRLLVVEGAWWDLVDEIATKLIGVALRADRPTVTPVVRRWTTDEDMWLRRTSIIAQLGHRELTDTDLLSAACRANLGDREFFIRKAIGWALRDYARTDPNWVRRFVDEHRDRMSGLSLREATKHL